MKLMNNVCFALLMFILSDVASARATADVLNNLAKKAVWSSNFWPEAGVGYPLHELNINYEHLLAYPNGSCEQESYLFYKEASQLGFHSQRVGLWNKDGLNDVMVDVKIDNKWYLFVPSTGVYFHHSSLEIVQNPSKAKNYSGTPLNGGEVFLTPDFFAGIKKIDIYKNINDYEFNLLRQSKILKQVGLMGGAHDFGAAYDLNVQNYIAGLEGHEKQGAETIWQEPIDIYRLYIKWYSSAHFSKFVRLVIYTDEQRLVFNSVDNTDVFHSDVSGIHVLPGNIKGVNKIEWSFSGFKGQNRLLIKELGVY